MHVFHSNGFPPLCLGGVVHYVKLRWQNMISSLELRMDVLAVIQLAPPTETHFFPLQRYPSDVGCFFNCRGPHSIRCLTRKPPGIRSSSPASGACRGHMAMDQKRLQVITLFEDTLHPTLWFFWKANSGSHWMFTRVRGFWFPEFIGQEIAFTEAYPRLYLHVLNQRPPHHFQHCDVRPPRRLLPRLSHAHILCHGLNLTGKKGQWPRLW